MKNSLRSLVTALVGAMVVSLLVVTPTSASTSPSLPSTTSYGSKGLNEMLRVTGRLYVSLDGLGTLDGTGNLQVDKPSAGAKVVGAYLTITQWNRLTTAPTDFSLNSQTVTFTHDAVGAGGGKNFLADVTSLVKTTIDAAGAGTLNLAVNEGTDNTKIEGSSLLVIFDDPDSVWGSVIFMFGSSDTSGDSFEASFPALKSNELTGHWLSLAIAFGYQQTDLVQSSTVTITTSAELSPQTLTQVAGGFDDGDNGNGALITVGGIGDSIENNPGTSTTFVSANRTDDELYGLEDYLAAGDTSITVNSRNPSNNDDIYQAVLYLNRVQIENAVTVDDPEVTALVGAPSLESGGAAASSEPSAPRSPRFARFDSYSLGQADSGSPQLAIEGVRLWCINSLTIDGAEVTFETGFSTPWYEYIHADITGIEPGPKTLVAQTCMGEVTYENWLTITSLVDPKSTWMKAQSFGLNEAMRSKIATFNSSLGDGYYKIRCIVNSANGEDMNEAFAKQICSFAQSNDLWQAEVVHETKATFSGRGYWVNIWASGGYN